MCGFVCCECVVCVGLCECACVLSVCVCFECVRVF